MGETTLPTTDRRYANLYDFAWVSTNHGLDIIGYRVIPFLGILNTIIDGRPWASVDALLHLDGLGPARIRGLREQGQARAFPAD